MPVEAQEEAPVEAQEWVPAEAQEWVLSEALEGAPVEALEGAPAEAGEQTPIQKPGIGAGEEDRQKKISDAHGQDGRLVTQRKGRFAKPICFRLRR